jgi:mRNA interferase RelE/StbE
MKPYRIEFKRSVLKEIRCFPRSVLERLRGAIEVLRTNPFPQGCEKIRGYEDYFRIRLGQYRIVYRVTTRVRIVTIVKVGHRRGIYRSL